MSEEVSVEAKVSSFAVGSLFPQFRYRVIKRGVDLLLVAISLPFCLPICGLLALLVRCSSSGPIFYREYRLGQFGKPFRIWKFRTMYTGEERGRRFLELQHTSLELRSTHKSPRDPRVTPVGRILRRWSLDEIPQLINVLRDEMALIGPRPIVEAERKLYNGYFSFYCAVQPGMSGLWQVSGRSKISYDGRVSLDCRYVQEWSLMLDAAILWKTFYVVATARGAC
jgi:lipopolysaccharide/colanic/teichoic acid biosynthesis glycosyltransferase